jgi:chromosome segregation ATPase
MMDMADLIISKNADIQKIEKNVQILSSQLLELEKENYNTDEEEKRFEEIKQENSQIINLLKSLETTIKGYEVAYTKAVLEKDKLRKELETYKGIINTLHRYCDWFQVKGTSSITSLNNLLEELEQKYLGGGE